MDNERSKSINEKLPGCLTGNKNRSRQVDGCVGLGLALLLIIGLLVFSG